MVPAQPGRTRRSSTPGVVPRLAGLIPSAGRSTAASSKGSPRRRAGPPWTGCTSVRCCWPAARGVGAKSSNLVAVRTLLPARGDGPISLMPVPLKVACSLHPRGWSPGMDGLTKGSPCSPRLRGWSRTGHFVAVGLQALPAPAGMVPAPADPAPRHPLVPAPGEMVPKRPRPKRPRLGAPTSTAMAPSR